MASKPESSLTFNCGQKMINRFMLAPMTNKQSNADGSLHEDELQWLAMRAKGQFGMVMTCASHVQEIGKGFEGQLGIFSDDLLPGHLKLNETLHQYDCLTVIQLHHAGMRSPKALIKETPVCPSENKKYGARKMKLEEVQALRDDFINSAIRAKKSGYNGVEIHGAHGYILSQFLSTEINKRTDEYGGSLENRSRLIFEIVAGIRKNCGPDFLLGVRLSPERFGMELEEVKWVCEKLAGEYEIDFLDISLWDYKKQAEVDPEGLSLLNHFTQLDLRNVKLTVAGKIRNGEDVLKVLSSGVDFVSIGRAAILHHDFPEKVIDNHGFCSVKPPVSEAYLKDEGVGPRFINYMRNWEGFVI